MVRIVPIFFISSLARGVDTHVFYLRSFLKNAGSSGPGCLSRHSTSVGGRAQIGQWEVSRKFIFQFTQMPHKLRNGRLSRSECYNDITCDNNFINRGGIFTGGHIFSSDTTQAFPVMIPFSGEKKQSCVRQLDSTCKLPYSAFCCVWCSSPVSQTRSC